MTTASPLPQVRRGQIWLIDWSPGRGAEQLGKRPGLIVQTDAGNTSLSYPNTIVAAVSTKGRPIPTHIAISRSSRNGLKQDSFVKCEQLTTISKSRLLGKPFGSLDPQDMARVDAALKRTLALP